jgi:sulfatase maturation enzyme AslB (radical SAM superfamily)
VANPNIFCNTPWYELHIYWDGSLGICCQESHKLYQDSDSKYNIANMTIAEWFDSEPVQNFRKSVLGDTQISACRKCYQEESAGNSSRRVRSNQKSVIFQQAFADSFAQSPNHKHFSESGITDTVPVDVHIDLGNHCNLACKMCYASASSKIAAQEVAWGIKSSKKYVGTDWTCNDLVWYNFKTQLINIKQLKNIHLMGGETLLSKRFEDLVDTFVDHKRYDVSFSFVTNGTVVKPHLIEKLKKFNRLGIEVSVETVSDHNGYVRQGTNTAEVLKNLQWYRTHISDTVSVTLRPAISMLTIGYYSQLLEYALQHQLNIKSLLVTTPGFLNVSNLPSAVKQQYLQKFDQVLNQLSTVSVPTDYNASDANNYLLNVKEQALICKHLLSTPTPANYLDCWQQLVAHCQRWDQVYGYNARVLYPELNEIWDKYGYTDTA